MERKLNAKPEALAARGLAPETDDSPLTRFSRELGERFPDTHIKRFVMPSGLDCREIFIREITSKDEINASIFADATASAIEKGSNRMMNDVERREAIRISIVGIGEGPAVPRPVPGKPVPVPIATRYRHVNHDGAPLGEINDWRAKAWTALHAYFAEVNGVPTDEIRSGLEGAQTVGAFAPPTTNASQPVLDGGK